MSRRLMLPLLFALLTLSTACGNAVGDGPPCAAPEHYPVCASARTGVLGCVAGEEIFTACDPGLTCLDVVDAESGVRLSECLPDTSIQCDPGLFLAACVDARTLLACVAPATYPSAGHTERITCAEGETCGLDVDHGACQLPAEPSDCDPETFAGACWEQRPVSCVDGVAQPREACELPDVCRIGPIGAFCVAAEASACGPDSYLLGRCDGADIVRCDDQTGFTWRESCPDGTLCRPGPEGPVCVDETTTCDPVNWVATCEGTTTRIFCAPNGVIVTEPCPLGTACQAVDGGATCLPPDAVPCDPATFVPECMGQGRIVECSPLTGYASSRPCGQMRHCIPSADGAYCE